MSHFILYFQSILCCICLFFLWYTFGSQNIVSYFIWESEKGRGCNPWMHCTHVNNNPAMAKPKSGTSNYVQVSQWNAIAPYAGTSTAVNPGWQEAGVRGSVTTNPGALRVYTSVSKAILRPCQMSIPLLTS